MPLSGTDTWLRMIVSLLQYYRSLRIGPLPYIPVWRPAVPMYMSCSLLAVLLLPVV